MADPLIARAKTVRIGTLGVFPKLDGDGSATDIASRLHLWESQSPKFVGGDWRATNGLNLRIKAHRFVYNHRGVNHLGVRKGR